MAPRETFLTSTAIEKTADGYYPFKDRILVPHEALRRELLRAVHALDHMDCVKYPWKAATFLKWFVDYFQIVVFTHHHAEEEIVGPHYKALGEHIEEWGTSDHNHKMLLENMANVETSARELEAVVRKHMLDGNHSNRIEDAAKRGEVMLKELSLKATFATMKIDFLAHLHEEEKIWPAVVEKYGKEEDYKVTQKIINEELKRKGVYLEAFKAFAGCVIDQMGYYKYYKQGAYPTSLPCALQLAPWAGEELADEFVKNAPFIPRTFLFPMFQRAYLTKWKVMIESVAGEEDILHVGSEKETEASTFSTVLWWTIPAVGVAVVAGVAIHVLGKRQK